MATKKSKSVVSPKDARLDITKFVEQLIVTDEVADLNDCFRAAVDTAAYLNAVRTKTMIQASRYVPGIIRTFGDKAMKGDMESAKLILGYVGFEEKDKPTHINNTQVNVTVPTLKDVLPMTTVEVTPIAGGDDPA
jgi:hypothetical protein